jgi:hypothetical protein
VLVGRRLLHGQRLDPATDGRPDPRPDVRADEARLGDFANDFEFSQPPRRPVVLPAHPKATLTGTPTPSQLPAAAREIDNGEPVHAAPRRRCAHAFCNDGQVRCVIARRLVRVLPRGLDGPVNADELAAKLDELGMLIMGDAGTAAVFDIFPAAEQARPRADGTPEGGLRASQRSLQRPSFPRRP